MAPSPSSRYLGNPDYNFDYDMADQAIQWVRNQKAVAPDRPFFVYYAPGATHAPHHPKKNGSQNTRASSTRAGTRCARKPSRGRRSWARAGRYRVNQRSPGIPAWDSLNAEQKKLYAHMMEVYAGYLSQTDYKSAGSWTRSSRLGELDNTLVIYISRRQRRQRRRHACRARSTK